MSSLHLEDERDFTLEAGGRLACHLALSGEARDLPKRQPRASYSQLLIPGPLRRQLSELLVFGRRSVGTGVVSAENGKSMK